MDQAILMRRDDTPYPEMLVVGGLAKHLDQAEAAVMDVWRHYKNPGLAGGYLWKQTIITNPSVGPSARSGHTAFLDKDHDQVLVFGGKPTSGSPSDYSVYALKFSNIGDPDLATWSKPVVQYAGVYPNPRYHHSMEVDVVSRKYQGSDLKSAVLFGGHGSGGTLYNDVWRLWIHASGDTVHWEEAAPVGDLPTVREGHTGTYESGSGRLIVFGGETSGGATDDIVKVLDLDNDPPTWRPFAARGYSLSGHTAVINSLIFARSPEIYTVGTNDWAQSPSSPHLQVWYPQMFQMPNGKVFAAGPAEDSYTFSPFSGVWEEFPPSSPPDHEIVGGGAVMYRPGLVMKAGSRDTEGENHAASGTTTWIDLTAGSPAWADGGSMSVGRVNHNLTVLPNGDVLATGGLGTIRDDQNIDPRRRPEIWSATNHAWSGGSGADTLAISRVPRGYHSTALLLPDGRIFCGGGNALEGAQNVGDVYCPPYLFNSGGTLATRPNLIAATGRWRYNADVTFAVSGDTAIRNACLIHAGATTHGQDGAQRYVPLTLLSSASRSDGVRQYFLKAPADSCIAPPGDYLLFVSNAAGVPAIAQWVRVGRAESGQFDVTAPDELTFGTTFIYCDAISAISWPAPGDDGGTGTALDYDIRYSWSPITSANFSNATPLPGVSIPQLAATTQSGIGFTGLTPSTQLYVAGKTRDKAGNWSALSFGQFSTLSSCGGGGYGASARRDRDEGSSGRVSNSPPGGGALSRGFAAPNALISSGSTLRLVGEFADEAAPRWQLDVRDLGDDRGLLEATMDHAVIQAPGADGTWWTRGSTPVSPGPMGVRSLPRGGRIIFPAGTALEAIELAPRGFACTGAAHSRLGDLRALDGTTTRPELASGDTLTLTFAPTTASSAGEDCFFRVRIPGAASPTTARARPGLTPRNPEAVDLPAVFALHAARPNPFSREAAIRFDLPRASAVKLEVFDVQGRRVATLANEVRDAGRHSLNWDGRTDSGPRAQAGIYLCRMTAGAFVSERRMSLLP